MQHVWGRQEAYTGFWWENLRKRDHLQDRGVDGRTIKMDLQEVDTCESGNEPSVSVECWEFLE
jgi:hypothetical protein